MEAFYVQFVWRELGETMRGKWVLLLKKCHQLFYCKAIPLWFSVLFFQFNAIDLISLLAFMSSSSSSLLFPLQLTFKPFSFNLTCFIHFFPLSLSLQADFSWSIKAENESVESLGSGDSKTFKDKSYYVLKEDYEIARTYRCVANNSVGVGTFCEIEVAGK